MDVSSLASQIDVHAFSGCFKTWYDFIFHMYQSVCSHIIPKRMVSARDGGKGIVKGLFDVDRRIPVRGLFFDIQTFCSTDSLGKSQPITLGCSSP